MIEKSRIVSILNTSCLDTSITHIQTFDLKSLTINSSIDFKLPTNLRLGHLAEKIVSELIKTSTNYKILFENIQIIDDKKTIGEIDFIIQEIKSKQIIHLELAYKFYLFIPNSSKNSIENWIGPNKKDSLIEKLDKLKEKQFPLLYHKNTQKAVESITINNVEQSLCLITNLYIPHGNKTEIEPNFKKAIKGYYLNFETFKNFHTKDTLYYIPTKLEWGIDPSTNKNWYYLNKIEAQIISSIEEKQSVLFWQKNNNDYRSFFIVWW